MYLIILGKVLLPVLKLLHEAYSIDIWMMYIKIVHLYKGSYFISNYHILETNYVRSNTSDRRHKKRGFKGFG